MVLGEDFTLKALRAEGYDAVFLGVGAPAGVGLGMPGDDAEGITDALSFLRTYNLRGSVPVGKNVVVIGGGNSAIDAARTALRLGRRERHGRLSPQPRGHARLRRRNRRGRARGREAAAADRAGRSGARRPAAWRASSACPCGWASSTAPAAAGPKKAATPSSSRPTRCWWPSARRSTCRSITNGVPLETAQPDVRPGQSGHRPDLGEVDLRRRRRGDRAVVGRRGGGGGRAGGRRHRPVPDRRRTTPSGARPTRSTRRSTPTPSRPMRRARSST